MQTISSFVLEICHPLFMIDSGRVSELPSLEEIAEAVVRNTAIHRPVFIYVTFHWFRFHD